MAKQAVTLDQLKTYHSKLKSKLATLEVPNAGNIAYDSSTTYPDASVGNAIKVVVDGEDNRKSTFDTNETLRTQQVTDWLGQSSEGGATYIVSQKAAELEAEFTMQTATTYPEDNAPADNTYYKLTDAIRSLTVASIYEDDGTTLKYSKGVIIEFEVPADCTNFAFSYPTALWWADADQGEEDFDGTPEVHAGYRYQLMIVGDNASLTMFGKSAE